MKTKMITLASAAALTMSLALPVYAGSQTMSDDALDAIAGKSNTSSTLGVDSSSVTATAANGNVQVGYYQWDDLHTNDASINKGGNVQSGSNSQVQQNVASTLNVLAWGAAAGAATVNTADIGGDQNVESWATMYIGGF